MKAPCLDCPKVGCGSYHDICPTYQEFRAIKEREYSERKKRFHMRYDIDQITRKRIDRVK